MDRMKVNDSDSRFGRWLRRAAVRLGLVVVVNDSAPGWVQAAQQPNDRPYHERVSLYQDALEASRHNPLAKTILDITTDFVLGDGISLASSHRRLDKFLRAFWHHPQNQMEQRLPTLSDELARAGDLFVLLFRNPQDGMSYIRLVTKEQISHIETAGNDWETELAYHQVTGDPTRPVVWYSPYHPAAAQQPAVMLHYAVNRPAGAAFGQGDLDTIIPWLQRYSRMLEDRARAHWAVKAFLWFVTVPAHRIEEKRRQYSRPPEPGSIVVKDASEEWEVKTPNMHASDARHDLQAIRHMIDAAGYPPHWRGEAGDANLATATAMQLRPERHLRRRQNYLVTVLQDIVYQAYARAWQAGTVAGPLPAPVYPELFTAQVPDISRADNRDLAQAALDVAQAFGQVAALVPPGRALQAQALKLLFRFAGEPLSDAAVAGLVDDQVAGPPTLAPAAPHRPANQASYPTCTPASTDSTPDPAGGLIVPVNGER
jgi:hypothetical protein